MTERGFPSQAWYLVHTKPQNETRAQVNLAQQGFEVFLPRMRRQVRHAGRYTERVEPMFPRYLFIRLEAGRQDWRPIHSTLGVTRLVRFGTWPATVPESLVEGLRSQADADEIVRIDVPEPLECGTPVRIIDGPLAGYEGLVQARSGRERVDVLLSLVNQQVSAQISPHQLARC